MWVVYRSQSRKVSEILGGHSSFLCAVTGRALSSRKMGGTLLDTGVRRVGVTMRDTQERALGLTDMPNKAI
jgi:hypothetical protein